MRPGIQGRPRRLRLAREYYVYIWRIYFANAGTGPVVYLHRTALSSIIILLGHIKLFLTGACLLV
ncbi:hypothetical protein GGR58DRAFT_451440 [Xylaria digitata]|nr:hypothetical protein GGR58DRAFT_451440 [Xylaria digitata]